MNPGDALIACLEDMSEAAHRAAWAAAHEWEAWARLEDHRAGRSVAPYGALSADVLAADWLPRLDTLSTDAGVWPALDEDGDELYRLVPIDEWRRELADQAEADAEEDARIAALDAAGVPPPPKYEPEPLPPIDDPIAFAVGLFEGIGGFAKGFHDNGIPTIVQVEWDKAASRVLAARFPDAIRYGDVRLVSGDAVRRHIEELAGKAAVILSGGFPCQDVSVASRRDGVAGERSNLYIELVRIADEVDPDWVVVENVPGLLTSKDRSDPDARPGDDFAAVLGALSGYRPPVPAKGWRNSGVCLGPKRSVAWRVLDARHLGVAQRRRRVFIVACPRDRAAPAAVLLEPEGVRGNPPPGAPPRPHTARPVAPADVRGGAAAADGRGEPDAGASRLTADEGIVTALTGGLGSGGPDAAHAQAGWLIPTDGLPVVAATLHGREQRGPDSDATDTLVAGEVAASTTDSRSVTRERVVSVTGDVTHTLTGEGFDASEDGTGRRNPIVPVAGGDLAERVAWQGQGSNVGPLGTLRSGNGNTGGGVPFVAEEFAPDVAATLTGGSCSELSPAMGAKSIGMGVSTNFAVRRLTPTECERLQAFPDGWTDVDGAADSPRYKQLGNAVATVCSGWVGWRIVAYLRGWRPG